MRNRLFIPMVMAAALPMAAQDDSWKKEIDNGLVQVSRRIVEPRETVSAEFPPALLVFLDDYSLRFTGATPREKLQGMAGEVLWHSGGRIGLENLSGRRLEVVRIVPTFSPDPSRPFRFAGRGAIQFENELIRVRPLRVPEGFRKDERRSLALVLQLAPAHIRFTYADGRVEEVRMNPREIRFEPAAKVTFENLGDRLELLRIDLKAGKQL